MVDPAKQTLVAMVDGRVKYAYCVLNIESWGPEVSLAVSALGVPLAEHAAAEMRRHGGSDRFDDVLDGVPAERYEWTDGVALISTWYVAPAAGIVVRIDLSQRQTDAGPDEIAAATVYGVRWIR